MNSRRKILFQWLFISLLIIISLITAEAVFRCLIFSPSSPFKQLKDPGKYAKISTDDYWKLYYEFGGGYRPPEHPHPYLGWIGNFDRKTFAHRDIQLAGNKKKVLIYGDSFIMCVHDSIQCFDEILNSDTAFSKEKFLISYGVGGYGVDQMYLLFSKTIDRFEKPFVVFSIMPADMDRSILSVRTGQKPYFVVDNDSLKVSGIPIDSVSEHFFKDNPPDISSYMWRRFINSSLNPYYDSLPTNTELRNKILTLNKKIILETYTEIKKRKLEYVFVVFDELWNEEGLWRADSLKSFLSREKIIYMNTRDLIKEDTLYKEYDYFNYMIKGNGHPKSYYNKLVCEEIKKYVFDYTNYSAKRQQMQSQEQYFDLSTNRNTIEYYTMKIKADKSWLKSVEEKAIKRNIPIDSMIKLDAEWMMNQKK
jgi:hypothetical protein